MEKQNVKHKEDIQDLRKRKRGCILSIIGAWMGLLVIILLVMLLVREKIVSRDAQKIEATANSYASWMMPSRFKPYSMTNLFGKTVLSYWDTENVREDGRSLAVIALYAETSWDDRDLMEIEKKFKAEAVKQLEKNEFYVQNEQMVEIELDGKKRAFTVYTGQQRIDTKMVDGSSCYFFLKSDQGKFQVYTLGIEDSFPREEQVQFMKSIRPVQGAVANDTE
ncbi:MAG: hypothetical protein CR997_05550 [Acidobacteria bacterium]|nr:MAG: hypothetical protein CR997_05550 [Acidobacteriota bacterium]